MKPLRAGSYRIERGEHYGTPKEVWGFSQPVRGSVTLAARRVLRANQELLGLEQIVPALERRAIVQSLGAAHVILQQRHRGVRVHRGFVTVHVSRRGIVYLIKNRAVPARLLGSELPFSLSRELAVRVALDAASATRRTARVPRDGIERRWFPRGKRLLPAYRVRVKKLAPPEDWIIYVDAHTGRVLSRWDNLAFARGSATLFDPSPVIALGDHARLVRGRRVLAPPEESYASVVLEALRAGSRLDGKYATTRLTPGRVRSADRSFRFVHGEPGLAEVMAYHHVTSVLRYLEALGYSGKRRIFREPIAINARATEDDDSWYDSWSKSLNFGFGRVPDAEDGETIVHELGHAIQDAICPDFGQSEEAAAMGEGFGDYLAASWFSHVKRGRYREAVMCWDGIVFKRHDPPCVRRIDHELEYEDFRKSRGEHSNGRIWSRTLWDVFRAFGREVSDTLIIESHFQLDGHTRMRRAARALLDADENLYRGRHRSRLERILRRRGFSEL